MFSVIVLINGALIGNPAAEPFGQPLKHSDGCKRGLKAVDVFNIFLHIVKVYSSGIDLAKNCTVTNRVAVDGLGIQYLRLKKHCCS